MEKKKIFSKVGRLMLIRLGLGGSLKIQGYATKLCYLNGCEPEFLWQRFIVSKHGHHSFECVAKGVKGTHQNFWKDIAIQLPFFFYLVICVVGDWKKTFSFFGKISRWGIGPSHLCFLGYIICSL